MSEFQLSPENWLNKTNYEEWFFQIGNILTAKNVFDYVEQNVIHKLETQMACYTSRRRWCCWTIYKPIEDSNH